LCFWWVALAQRLVEANAGGDGDVKALDAAAHGDANQQVAVLAGEPAEPAALAAEDEPD
jgi:hypothetical protein